MCSITVILLYRAVLKLCSNMSSTGARLQDDNSLGVDGLCMYAYHPVCDTAHKSLDLSLTLSWHGFFQMFLCRIYHKSYTCLVLFMNAFVTVTGYALEQSTLHVQLTFNMRKCVCSSHKCLCSLH
jgi:hypothetical protein